MSPVTVLQSILRLYAWLFLDVTWHPNTSGVQYNGNDIVFGKSHQVSCVDFSWGIGPPPRVMAEHLPPRKGTL